MILTISEKYDELLEFYGNEYLLKNNIISTKNENLINDLFDIHIKNNLIEIPIAELYEKYNDEFILIDSPDGYQPIGDFWKKSERDCYLLKTSEYKLSCSNDHLVESINGWKF